MLKYEEKLHLDKIDERLRKNNYYGGLLSICFSFTGFVLLYYLIRRYASVIPDITAWNQNTFFRKIYGIEFTYADAIYFIVGAVLMCYGSGRLTVITRQNYSVRDRDASLPSSLLTEGCYSIARHPMYGSFVIMNSSVFIALHSLLGLLISAFLCTFQIVNAVFEEHNNLIPAFGEQYVSYKGRVRNLMFRKSEASVLAFIVLITVIGLFF